MSVPQYEDRGPLKIPYDFNLESLKGKSVVITGGGSGLGKAYAKAFVAAGAYVTIGDFNEAEGSELAALLSSNAQFVKCDVRNWDDQVQMFEAATKNSPHKSCDIVIANAGISGQDEVFMLDDPTKPPVKPEMPILEVNLIGVLYTTKLAMHYFRRQTLDSSRDRCLIIKSSIAGYLDMGGAPQYNISKFGGRALMRGLRRTGWMHGVRVNLVAPWFIKTKIAPEEFFAYVATKVDFAEADDAVKAMFRIACDTSVNGRSLCILPRSLVPEGYIDLDHDDYKDGDLLKDLQEKSSNLARGVMIPQVSPTNL